MHGMFKCTLQNKVLYNKNLYISSVCKQSTNWKTILWALLSRIYVVQEFSRIKTLKHSFNYLSAVNKTNSKTSNLFTSLENAPEMSHYKYLIYTFLKDFTYCSCSFWDTRPWAVWGHTCFPLFLCEFRICSV